LRPGALLERSTPSPRLNETFDERPQCGACWDSGGVECAHDRAALVAVRVPRLLATTGSIAGSAAAASALCVRGSTRRSIGRSPSDDRDDL
jgi:hypothetical protein